MSHDLCNFRIDPHGMQFGRRYLVATFGAELYHTLMDRFTARASACTDGWGIHNAFQLAKEGTPEGVREQYKWFIENSHVRYALALLCHRADALTPELFMDSLPQLLTYMWESGDSDVCDFLWNMLPEGVRDDVMEKTLQTWWARGHEELAVRTAQSTKVNMTTAMLFALGIAHEHPAWSQTIVEKHTARELEARGIQADPAAL